MGKSSYLRSRKKHLIWVAKQSQVSAISVPSDPNNPVLEQDDLKGLFLSNLTDLTVLLDQKQ